MRASVRAAFVGFTEPLEGSVAWMYLDVLGLVTVGIGNLIDPPVYAVGLPFVHEDGTPASRAEIAEEWARVKADRSLAQKGHRAAKLVTKLRLTPEGIEQVVFAKLEQVDSQLAARFPQWEEWPAAAQLATLSLSWACGAGFRFPKLEAALKAQDWATAATECKMNAAGNPGIVPRNAANRALFLLAAQDSDPDDLTWTVDAPPSTQPENVQPRNPDTAAEGIADAAVAEYQRDRDAET